MDTSFENDKKKIVFDTKIMDKIHLIFVQIGK